MRHNSPRLPAVVAALLCAWLAAGCDTLGNDVIEPIVTGILTDLRDSVSKPLAPEQIAACWEGSARAARPATWMRPRAHNPGGPVPDNPLGAPTHEVAVIHPQKERKTQLAEPQNTQPAAYASLTQPKAAAQPIAQADNLPLAPVLPSEPPQTAIQSPLIPPPNRIVSPTNQTGALTGLNAQVRVVSPSTSPELAHLWSSYRGFEYDNVIQLVKTTARQPNRDPFLRASAYILAGAAAYMNGNTGEAHIHFLRAAKLDPGAVPDPAVFPSEIQAMHKQAIACYEKETIP